MNPPFIKGQPYSAEEISEQVSSALRIWMAPARRHMMYYRDSEGRTRIERPFPADLACGGKVSPKRMIHIEDPVAGYFYFLNPLDNLWRRNKISEIPRPLSVRTAGVAPPARVTSESLGSRMIEGVMVNGTRITTTYAIGYFGNDRPLTTVEDMWMSPELGRAVQTKISDPRTGETTMRLINISRSDPDPALFQIPADYEIKDTN